MANYRVVLDQRWDAEAGSLRSRASSVISTGTKFSFSTSAYEEHPNIDGVLGRLNSVASRGRPGSVLSCEEPAPPYEDQEAVDRPQGSPSAEHEAVSRTQSSTPVAEENTNQSTTPPSSDSENALSAHYTRIIRSLDNSHGHELSALRSSLAKAQDRIELLTKEHEHQLAATRNEIDQTYRKEYKAVRREVEKTREDAATAVEIIKEAAAMEAVRLKEEHEKAVVKARNAVEDLWETRWSDRMKVAAEEVERIETRGRERVGSAGKRIRELAKRYPELAVELEKTVEELEAT